MIEGLMRFTFFHTEYGIPSGPGAEEGELFERASLISSFVRGRAEGFLVRHPLLGRGAFGGKKWFRSALLIETGSSASGREGNQGFFLERPIAWLSRCCQRLLLRGNQPSR